MNSKIKILGIAGSLRKGSFNKTILREAVKLVPENCVLEISDIKDIPIFNADLQDNLPIPVKKFKEKIRAADAILFATPEYNFSLPGVLKNAIDWASRPFGDNSWEAKPVAIMGASNGMIATARAQLVLRQVMTTLNMFPINHPQVMVPFAQNKIDKNGQLTDEKTREKIKELLIALAAWTKRIKG